MSFLAGRLASTEGAYFFQESKHAVDRLIQKNKKNSPSASPPSPLVLEEETKTDVLPAEFLGHSLPSKGFKPLPADSALERAPRLQLSEGEHSVLASTENELRTDMYTTVDPGKLKAAAANLSKIAIATAVLFDATTLTFGLSAPKLQFQNGDDIRNKARDMFHPKLEGIEEQLAPLRAWTRNTSKEWCLKREEAVKENRFVKELQEFSKRSAVKTSN